MPTSREIPDKLWAEIEKVIPPRPSRAKGGRPPADDRKLFNGIFFILRTGAPWRDMPEKYGPWQTVYDRFAEWRDAKVFEQIWAKCLRYYDHRQEIEWEWQSEDGTYVRSPLGGKDNGPNPTDRAKPGMKDHILVDGRGVPLSAVVTAANVNDHIALPDVLGNHVVVRPQPSSTQPQHLCLDAAFDNDPARWTVCREYYTAHIAPAGGRPDDAPQHEGGQARRWVVERAHAWLDRFRRLVVNWEKNTESRYAFLCLACALIAFRF
jgi:putative transposase